MTATTLLRPVHGWIGLWDALVGPVARVAAVLVGAAVTAGLSTAAGLPLLAAAPVAVVLWIGLAVAQEHDARVHLDPDRAFADALADAVAPLGLVLVAVSGPPRTRPGDPDRLVLGAAGDDDDRSDHPFAGWYIQVERSRDGHTVHVHGDLDEGTSGRPVAVTWTRSTSDGDGPAPAVGAVVAALGRARR